jgi:heme exporter protein C
MKSTGSARPDQLRLDGGGAWLSALGWIAPLAVVVAQVFAISSSPPDRDMGHLQKIMYVHVPIAWNFMIAVVVTLYGSVRYLVSRDDRHDLLAASAAEIGTVFMGLTLILGSIWGRLTWGVWWAWDARLTSTAVVLLIFVGYFALRAFTEDPERRARWSAAVGIFGAINVYIVYMSVRWWRTLHQEQSSPSTVDPAYAWGLRANAIAVLLLLIYFIGKRYQIARMERAAEHEADAAALVEGTPGAIHV